MRTRLFDAVWAGIILLMVAFLLSSWGEALFVSMTKDHPIVMGFIKFAILATMGELLARRIVDGKWTIKGIRCYQRTFVWGALGVLFTYIFPLYSDGVEGLVSKGLLPDIFIPFWKSFWMNILFAFPMMIFHRITDTLIDRGRLFSKWPFMEVWNGIDWRNMWGFVAPSILWFWVPAHTITFCLPPEYRIIMAAGLSICLGAILAFAKKRSSANM